jgi:4-aminobutyrate aminotransferase-like enzyme
VALETVKLMEEEDFETRVMQRGAYFLAQLKTLAKTYPQIGDVDGLGLALRIEMCQRDGYTPNRELTDAIMNIGLSGTLTAGGRSKGLILDVGGYYKNVFTIAPSLYITEPEIDTAMALFEEALLRGIAQTE